MTAPTGSVLVAGASGAIGSRLVERLVASGAAIVPAGRHPDQLTERWPNLEPRHLDVLDAATIPGALEGVKVACYLIHSMEPGAESFEARDRAGARDFARAAVAAGVERVVYLGAMGPADASLSKHLESRQETGRVLAEEGPPLIEFRAGMVVGTESASFRMLRDLVRRLPAMIVPRWVQTRSQPIAIDDAVSFLAAASGELAGPTVHHEIVEIGGADIVSYREMIERYARLTGHRRVLLPVPFLTPQLSSLWCGLTTSVPTDVARPLIDGMVVELIVDDANARRLFPGVHPVGIEEALRRTLD